uniref:Zgc:109913 n=1 Tax=Fundulus heteroclitus TaxID=8078 RepID=A0A3Q2QCZ3_FUNHE
VESLPVSNNWWRRSEVQLIAASYGKRSTRQERWLTGSAQVTPVCLSPVCYLSVSHLPCPSAGLSDRLLRLLSACDSAPTAVEDRQASERLWVLFLSAVENFLSDLRKAKDLIGQFPLTQRSNRRSLVNTGCTDGLVGLAARVALVQIPWLVLEEEPSPDLTNHIAGLESLLSELQQRVSHKPVRTCGTPEPWLTLTCSTGSSSFLVGGGNPAGLGRSSQRPRRSRGQPGGHDGGGDGLQR